ncbi:hypothetical protein ACCQ14_09050 [Xanthomonas sp. NCPPB 2865]|uniref:hypothetical protein n=1 Tax=unclassified Xanthomonas TaxID=2643310 RepID=UPI001CF8D4E6|nr:hypothetical protein [Xanthomonas sp. MWU16-30325]
MALLAAQLLSLLHGSEGGGGISHPVRPHFTTVRLGHTCGNQSEAEQRSECARAVRTAATHVVAEAGGKGSALAVQAYDDWRYCVCPRKAYVITNLTRSSSDQSALDVTFVTFKCRINDHKRAMLITGVTVCVWKGSLNRLDRVQRDEVRRWATQYDYPIIAIK